MKSTIVSIILLVPSALNASKFESFIKQSLETIIDGADQPQLHKESSTSKGAETYNGPTFLSGKKFKKLTVYGPTDLRDVNVSEKLDVAGPLSVNKAQINEIKVAGPVDLNGSKIGFFNIYGPLDIKDSQINEDSTLYGPLEAIGSKFDKGLTVYARELHFESSSLKSLIVFYSRKDEKGLNFNLGNKIKITIGGNSDDETKSDSPIVYLKKGSKIFGGVEFKGDPGKVILEDGSKVHGKIINGKVIGK